MCHLFPCSFTALRIRCRHEHVLDGGQRLSAKQPLKKQACCDRSVSLYQFHCTGYIATAKEICVTFSSLKYSGDFKNGWPISNKWYGVCIHSLPTKAAFLQIPYKKQPSYKFPTQNSLPTHFLYDAFLLIIFLGNPGELKPTKNSFTTSETGFSSDETDFSFVF